MSLLFAACTKLFSALTSVCSMGVNAFAGAFVLCAFRLKGRHNNSPHAAK
jgi:hypothetical protein